MKSCVLKLSPEGILCFHSSATPSCRVSVWAIKTSHSNLGDLNCLQPPASLFIRLCPRHFHEMTGRRRTASSGPFIPQIFINLCASHCDRAVSTETRVSAFQTAHIFAGAGKPKNMVESGKCHRGKRSQKEGLHGH